jgi:hypothetical protein
MKFLLAYLLGFGSDGEKFAEVIRRHSFRCNALLGNFKFSKSWQFGFESVALLSYLFI